MSVQSDFKSSPFALFTSKGGQTSADLSLATLVGVKFASTDSREFTLVQNGATALAAGVLVQGPATIGANHTGLAIATAAATGATSLIVTLAAVVTANQYAGGLVTIPTGTNNGLTMKIASHASAAATAPLTLFLEDPLSSNIAVSGGAATLTLNPYGSLNGTDYRTHGVIIAPSSTSTGQLVGVTFYPIAASTATVPSYGWIQTNGPVACLATGTATAGLGCMLGDINGSVAVHVVVTNAQIGRFAVTAVTNCKNLIMLDL